MTFVGFSNTPCLQLVWRKRFLHCRHRWRWHRRTLLSKAFSAASGKGKVKKSQRTELWKQVPDQYDYDNLWLLESSFCHHLFISYVFSWFSHDCLAPIFMCKAPKTSGQRSWHIWEVQHIDQRGEIGDIEIAWKNVWSISNWTDLRKRKKLWGVDLDNKWYTCFWLMSEWCTVLSFSNGKRHKFLRSQAFQ